MTDAEHADLSRRLALAIGWPAHLLHSAPEPLYGWRVWAWCEADPGCDPKNRPPWWPWRPFDYRDELVIWRVAERFACFPFRHSQGGWWAWVPGHNGFSGKHGDTAAEAVARAVVEAHK